MPVSGNEEQQIGVRSWPLLDVSAGIPPKKRRLLLVPPPSPPRNEAQSSPTGDNGKKIDEVQPLPCKETENVKMIDGSCSDLKKEGSLSDLEIPEQSNPVCNSILESVPHVKIIGGDDGSKCLNPEGFGSEVSGKESGLDLKNKTVNGSKKRPLSSNPPDNTPDLSEVRPVDILEVETKFLLTEESAAPDVPLNTVGFPSAGQEGKIQYKQDFVVQNNEGNSPGHGKSDASQVSLSLSKGTSSMETKATDVVMGTVTGKDDLSSIRMNWDLNTLMDSWHGSDVDASKKGSCTTTNPNSILQFLNSTDSGGIFNNKGKQLIETEEHASKHSICPVASIHGNHELEDSLRLTLGMASGEMKTNEGLSAEVASKKYLFDSSQPNAPISTASTGSIGCGIVKPEPSGDNSKKSSVQTIAPPKVFVDSCSVKRESAEKMSGQASIKSEPVMEDTRGRIFHHVGSSSGLSPVSSLATSSALSASVGLSNQSEFTFQTNDTQASNCSSVQVCTEVHKHAQKLLETEASGQELAKISNNSEISQLKISKTRNNSMRVNGDRSVSDEEKLNISVETREYECYGSECESDGNHSFAIRLKTQDIHVREEEDDFEDGEVREAQAHVHTSNPDIDTPEIECVKLVNSDANSSVCIDGGLRNNINDIENRCDRTDDNINDERLTGQDPTLTANDKMLVDISQIKTLLDQKGCIPDCAETCIAYDEPSGTFNRTMENTGETTDDNVQSDEMGNNKLDPSPSKVEVNLKRDEMGNKSRIITLPRTSMASPFETKSFPSSSLPFTSGREREDFGLDGCYGFVRERFQEPYFRNPRNNYTRGRGGGRFGGGRMGKPRVDWDSDRDLRRFNQSKFSAYNDTEMEPSNYPIAPNDVDTSRGRKPIKDLPSFHRPFSRRQSPGGRDDPPARDMRRNNDVHGADFVGVRNEKFSRPNNSSYNRSNSGYEDVDDGQFVRGRGKTGSFTTGQRRFFPKVRSKSPIGSRNHSPGGGAWSPRRRSPDRFKLLPKVVERRPGSLYGASDTMSFPEDIVSRRRASPSYVGRATNLDSGTEHGHPRPFRRSPSDRVFNRSSGRQDVLIGGPQISRCDDDDFFNLSAGFREVNGEGSSNDDRRKFNERNHSFRPTYNTENEDRRFHVDNGSRSFRFRSDGCDDEYPEGRNMGGDNREFDGRIKNRHIVENPRRLKNY